MVEASGKTSVKCAIGTALVAMSMGWELEAQAIGVALEAKAIGNTVVDAVHTGAGARSSPRGAVQR